MMSQEKNQLTAVLMPDLSLNASVISSLFEQFDFQGADNCLEGLTFVITGVLESIERDEAKSLIERYGGKVTGNVSKKTNYLVMGRDSGQSKSDKVGSSCSPHGLCSLASAAPRTPSEGKKQCFCLLWKCFCLRPQEFDFLTEAQFLTCLMSSS